MKSVFLIAGMLLTVYPQPLAAAEGTDESVVASKAEQLAKLQALKEEAEAMEATQKPLEQLYKELELPTLELLPGENNQDFVLRVHLQAREARRRLLAGDYIGALRLNRSGVKALASLPPDWNAAIIESRKQRLQQRIVDTEKFLRQMWAEARMSPLPPPLWQNAKFSRILRDHDEELMEAGHHVHLRDWPKASERMRLILERQQKLRQLPEGRLAYLRYQARALEEILQRWQGFLVRYSQQRTESSAPSALMSGVPAPMEGEQALFLKTVRQVQNARKYEEQGRLRPALAEYEEALKNMKKMAPQLKHGDGGPDDDVRDAIRRLKGKVKK